MEYISCIKKQCYFLSNAVWNSDKTLSLEIIAFESLNEL